MYIDSELQAKKNLTLLLYVLYGFAIFSAGILAIVALIVNYVKRDAMHGTIYASHFTWQIRTVWWYLFWNILGLLPFGYLFLVLISLMCLLVDYLPHWCFGWWWQQFLGFGLSIEQCVA